DRDEQACLRGFADEGYFEHYYGFSKPAEDCNPRGAFCEDHNLCDGNLSPKSLGIYRESPKFYRGSRNTFSSRIFRGNLLGFGEICEQADVT
ncbi:hypothetical protein A2U01_0062880, partial [Trifolium medium]|nr:hypothetical protein [Trifolium medium]